MTELMTAVFSSGQIFEGDIEAWDNITDRMLKVIQDRQAARQPKEKFFPINRAARRAARRQA